ncbi:MAG TPA: hypothetical protein PLW99_02005 [Candidatus Paceibacterota bacterium]|nr:MAG: hypothetical protein B7X03_03050 [Parcubacteria group bacterium 21-58-10]HQT82904.1 hypothetical protein [Candidatus Paceibacterota bacterium]
MQSAKIQFDPAKPLFLYVDGEKESKTAETLLRNRNIPIHVVEGCLDAGWNYPLLQFHPWEFEGLTEIRNFLTLPGIQ